MSSHTCRAHLCEGLLLALQLVAPYHQRRHGAPVGVLHQKARGLASRIAGLVGGDLEWPFQWSGMSGGPSSSTSPTGVQEPLRVQAALGRFPLWQCSWALALAVYTIVAASDRELTLSGGCAFQGYPAHSVALRPSVTLVQLAPAHALHRSQCRGLRGVRSHYAGAPKWASGCNQAPAPL